MLGWVATVVGLIGLGFILYWLLVLTEGVFLGRRMVVWLYDLTAKRYDRIKQFDPGDENLTIGRPLLQETKDGHASRILDVATGTGRVPVVLLRSSSFHGLIIGLDPAHKMLDQAQKKFVPFNNKNNGRAELVQQRAAPLPFKDGAFDIVTCLEALEFFPSEDAALDEMVRVLRPGGFLMTSRRIGWEGKLFLWRYRPADVMEKWLTERGLIDIQTHLWELNYDMVTARKPAEGTP
jgi:ubiquinone/menaquinone biosynthesis C-methylase UbiE